MKTKVTNKTHDSILLKEGTQGVYRKLKELKSNEEYVITVDPNATYREYWCAAKDDHPHPMILSSDDCQDNDSIEIYYVGGTYKWRKSTEAPKKWFGGVLKEKWNAFWKRDSGSGST